MSEQEKISFVKNLFNGHILDDDLKHFPFFTTPRESDFQMMSQSVADWAEQNLDSRKFDTEKKLPQEVLQGMREMGLFGLIIPESLGGSELTQTFFTRMLELLNQYDSSVALTVGAHTSIGMKGLYLYGTPEQKAKYMPKLACGDMIASFALTEPSAGSDAAAIKTRAVRSGDHYVLNGSKLWITNGGFADFFTVFAKEEVDGQDKMTAFIVTRDMGGVSHGPEEHKLGIKASSTVEVFFKDVKVPAENILGKSGDGFKIAMNILNQGRMGLSGAAVGVMKSTLKSSIEYAKNRKAFGHSICEFEMIQGMLSNMAMDTYTAESLIYFSTYLVDKGNTDYSIEAAICKVFATESCWRNINTAMQIHGGNGYMVDYGLERKLRDERISLIFEGTNEILRLFVAMTGLKEPASQYQRVGKELQSVKNLDSLNSALTKLGFLSDFAMKEVKKTVFTEKLEGVHPALEKECAKVAQAVQILASSSSRLIRKYGHKLVDKQLQLARLADIAIDTYAMCCVLSRIHSVLKNSQSIADHAQELEMAKVILRNAKMRIDQNTYQLKSNRDSFVKVLSQKCVDSNDYPFPIGAVNATK